MAIEIDREATLKTAFGQGINLFLGAGFSVLAESSVGGRLPLGEELKLEMCSHFSREDLSALSLSRLYDVLSRQIPSEVNTFLKARFTVSKFNELYNSIQKINVK